MYSLHGSQITFTIFSQFILLFGYRLRITYFIVIPIPGSASRPGFYFTPVVTLSFCGCLLPHLFLIIPCSSSGLIVIHLSDPSLCHVAMHIHIIVPVLFNSWSWTLNRAVVTSPIQFFPSGVRSISYFVSLMNCWSRGYFLLTLNGFFCLLFQPCTRFVQIARLPNVFPIMFFLCAVRKGCHSVSRVRGL